MYPRRSLHPSTAVVYTMRWSGTPGRDMAGEFVDSAEDYGVTVPRMDGSNLQETNLVAGPLVVDKCLSRMFVAAYLLTGSTKQAEAAMLESIRQLDIQA